MSVPAHNSVHYQVIQHLDAQGHASLIDLACALFPECFVGDDLASRQTVIERVREQCARLVESELLTTAYSPTDGDLVYCIREVFHQPSGPAGDASTAITPAAPDGQPSVFRRRGDPRWRGTDEPAEAIAPVVSDAVPAVARTSYAVFFKLGTTLRPACDMALRELARVAAQATQIHVVGQASRLSGMSQLSGMLASQRAAVVANRLVDFGVDRFRIELSVQAWNELPLALDVLTVDPPKNLLAQSRRVDINLQRN